MIDKLVTEYGRTIHQQIGIGTAGAFALEGIQLSRNAVRSVYIIKEPKPILKQKNNRNHSILKKRAAVL
jgi:hypothetical protein